MKGSLTQLSFLVVGRMRRRMSSEKEVGRVLVWEPRWVRWVSAC